MVLSLKMCIRDRLEKEQAIFKKERIRAERKIAACQEEVEKAKRTAVSYTHLKLSELWQRR